MLGKFIEVSVCVTIIIYIINSCVSPACWGAELYNITNVSTTNDSELKHIAEELFNKSPHKLHKFMSVNYQGNTTFKNFTDNAPERFLNVSTEILSVQTVRSFVKLFDNYELNTYQPENVTQEEIEEENEFINNLMKTDTMLHAMNFLSHKGFVPNDTKLHKEILKEIWFYPYSRSKGVNGSSGFEHVFLVERKPRKGIIGLHNWIFFALEESLNKINYYGYSRHIEFPHGAAAAQIYFTYNDKRKMSTVFIGTTPELEIALYTVCFFARPNKKCRVSFAGINFAIQTYVSRNDGKQLVGSAFPLI